MLRLNWEFGCFWSVRKASPRSIQRKSNSARFSITSSFSFYFDRLLNWNDIANVELFNLAPVVFSCSAVLHVFVLVRGDSMKILCFPIQNSYRFDLTLKFDFKTNINYPIISFTCCLLTVSNQMPKNTSWKPIDFAFPTTTFPIQFPFCVLNFLIALTNSCLNTHMA